jgi:protein-disulfide isomerase
VKRSLPFLIIATVGLVALAGGALLYRAKNKASLASLSSSFAAKENVGATPLHIRGEKSASLTLEEFGDFECPPCAHLSSAIRVLEEDYHPRLRVVFREFPLAMHAHARDAAAAAEAAGLQGRFWEMHDLLYEHRDTWSTVSDVRAAFDSYAEMIGLDRKRFAQDFSGESVRARIALDQSRGNALKVIQTPTIYINGREVAASALNLKDLRALLQEALEGKPALETQ